MSTIPESIVEKVAQLARLAITPDEMPLYAKNLSNIITLVEQMNQIDTKNIEPMAHPLEMNLRLREDVVSEPNERELMQTLAPAEAGLYLVPQVIE